MEQWRSYLQHSEFTIYTDQKSLAQLDTQRLHTAWQQKVFTKLLGFQYKVLYKKGVENSAADALSRHPAPPVHIMHISCAIPQWLTSVVASYASNSQAQALLQQLSLSTGAVGHYTLHQGVIKYKNKIQLQVYHALHARRTFWISCHICSCISTILLAPDENNDQRVGSELSDLPAS